MRTMLREVPWLAPALQTVATVVGAYLLGRLLSVVVAGRLARLARSTAGQWDDVLSRALTTRIPLWSVLAGAWLSLDYWSIAPRWVQFSSRGLTMVGLASLTFAMAAVATGLLAAYGARAWPGLAVSGLTQNVVRLVVVSFGGLAILNELGVEIRPMLAALGVGGLAVALALQEPLSNLFAGVFVTMSGQIRIGDYVRLDSGLEGRVVDFNWRSTALEVPPGNTAVVPNGKLAQAIVTNFDLPTSELSVPVDFVVDYQTDAAEVEAVALAVAKAVMHVTDGAVASAEPLVRFQGFGETGLKATAVLRARSVADQANVRHAFVAALHAAFSARGIVLATTAPPRSSA